jgi:hypothetical protein
VDVRVERLIKLYARIQLSLSRPEVVADKAEHSYILRRAIPDPDRDLDLGFNSEQGELGGARDCA